MVVDSGGTACTTLQNSIVASEVRRYDSTKVNRRERGTRYDSTKVNCGSESEVNEFLVL